MAVSIRLRREGTKNRPYYKVVVADRRSPRDGKFIEIIGTYDPKIPGRTSRFKIYRVEYWIGNGAHPSDTVRILIKNNKKPAATAEPEGKTEQNEQQSVEEPSSPPPPPTEDAS